MYPSAELAELQRRKALLRQRIAGNRLRCVAQAGEVSRPIAWFDRFLAQWHRISPMLKFAAIPLGLLFRRKFFGGRTRAGVRTRHGIFGQVLTWLPLVLRGVRLFRAHHATAAS